MLWNEKLTKMQIIGKFLVERGPSKKNDIIQGTKLSLAVVRLALLELTKLGIVQHLTEEEYKQRQAEKEDPDKQTDEYGQKVTKGTKKPFKNQPEHIKKGLGPVYDPRGADYEQKLEAERVRIALEREKRGLDKQDEKPVYFELLINRVLTYLMTSTYAVITKREHGRYAEYVFQTVLKKGRIARGDIVNQTLAVILSENPNMADEFDIQDKLTAAVNNLMSARFLKLVDPINRAGMFNLFF
jgi:hypothetical protein